MNNTWSDSPNAKYIDMILADLKANPKKWGDARYSIGSAVWSAAWSATRNAAWDSTLSLAKSIAFNVVGGDGGDAVSARGAVLALMTYDDCAYLLDEKPEYVRFLALLGGSSAATLLYPACVALQREMA